MPVAQIVTQAPALRGREVQAAHGVARRHHERDDVWARQELARRGQLGVYAEREEEVLGDGRGRPGDQLFDAHDRGEEFPSELLEGAAEEVVDDPCAHAHERDVRGRFGDRGEQGHGKGFYGVEGPRWPGGGEGHDGVEGEAEVVDVGGGCVSIHV